MGAAASSLPSPTCPNCTRPFAPTDKHCTRCGYQNPVFVEASQFGVVTTSRSDDEHAAAARAADTGAGVCPWCQWPIERGQVFCRECGVQLPALDPAYTPRTRQTMLRRASTTRRSEGQDERDFHPMGLEALVTPMGKPTRKLQALADAIFEMLQRAPTGSHSRKPVVDIHRLRYFEYKLGRREEYMLGSLPPAAILAVYKSMALDHVLVPFPPPMQHMEAPCLTRAGFLQYVLHALLYDPHEAVRELRQLLADTPELAGPPAWLTGAGSGRNAPWKIEENMALSHPHPLASEKQQRMLDELADLGHAVPGTPGGSRGVAARPRPRRPTNTAADGTGLTPAPGSPPYLSPYYNYAAFPPYAYPSPGLAPNGLPSPYWPAQYGWPAYPPHPYSPQAHARTSPFAMQQGLPPPTEYRRPSPRRRVNADWDFDFRESEEIR